MFSGSIARGFFTLSVMFLAGGIYAQGPFRYEPPGQLIPGSGQGRNDSTVYLRGMRFPLEAEPAYANSQVWGVGGSQDPSGSQCDVQNYSYPWRDNYCETRSFRMPYCPSGHGHQGQDIRPATCTNAAHWAVAVEAGTIIHIGFYSVYLQGDSGIRHRYLHLDHDRLAVTTSQKVDRGERIGLVSDNHGSGSTTIHLHFDMYSAGQYIPTYMSLVRSYEELLGVSP